jgi:aminomethyltransferase
VKHTPFFSFHVKEGAKMVPFAGFEMPVEYAGVRHEHRNVRENMGVFDVSHMGEIWIKGEGAQNLVQKLTTNDIQKLGPGMIQYSCFPNETGGIVDDLLVYAFAMDTYLLVVNAANIQKDYQWIMEHNQVGATVENVSDEMAQLAVQGPGARALLQELTDTDLGDIPYYHFRTGKLAGVENVILSHTGYTGAGGFEVYMDREHAPKIWEALFDAGREKGLEPAGLAARDTLRLEMGFCLYGNDILDTTSPIEAGLGWITKFTEGNEFINRAALEQQKAEGPQRKLVGFVLKDRGIPRQHYPILNGEGEEIGQVTSGTMSPMTGQGIGMGYVQKAYAARGSELFIAVRNKRLAAEVVRPPFFQSNAGA